MAQRHLPPSYRQRAGSTHAIVTLTDSATGRRRDYWLGEFGTPPSRELYHRLIAEWESLGRRWPQPPPRPRSITTVHTGTRYELPNIPARAGQASSGPTVAHVVLAYWRAVAAHHRFKRANNIKSALRLLRRLDGSTPAPEYGPRKLRTLRDAMVLGDPAAEPPRPPWSRRTVNDRVRVVLAVFRWAAAEEMIPASVPQALSMVEPLRRGRTIAREGTRVRPVPEAAVEAVRKLVSPQVRAMIDLQLLTGARPGELVGLRPGDLDTSAPDVWSFRPTEHKTAFRGKTRIILFGPRAQSVLRPFLGGRGPGVPLFSPAEAEDARRAEKSARRRTPPGYGNSPGSNRRAFPARAPGEMYTVGSYRRCIERACDAAFPPPDPLARRDGESLDQWRGRLTPAQSAEIKAWRKQHRWHPHQLRHSAATNIRREFGLEAAQLVLGHSSAAITDAVYAERDLGKVVEVMRRVG